jgi:hypothetical protein
MTDGEQRQLARILLDAAQAESDDHGEFMVPANVLVRELPPERLTVDRARRLLGIEDRIWDQEHQRHFVVHQILSGTRKHHRRAS